MKKIYLLICFIVMSVALCAQTPESFSYQAVVRDASNQPKTNSPVSIRISILQGSAAGSVVYRETHSVTTDENGMLSLAIGTGTVVSGAFADIDWGTATYFLKSETDPDGGSDYTLTTTQQLVSVPYALYAKSAGNTLSAEEIQQMFDDLREELGNTIDSLNEEIENLTEELNVPCPGTVTDDEGNQYATVKLGRQCWMAENLRSTTYYGYPLECGDTIENASLYGWFYFTDGTDVSKTGCLYTSLVAGVGENSSSVPSNVQGICPAGWHLPSVSEWSQLFSYVGGNSSYCCSSNPSYIAKALASRVGWQGSYNPCAIGNQPEYNNATGFNVKPAVTTYMDELGNAQTAILDPMFLTSDPSTVSFGSQTPTVGIWPDAGIGYVRCVYGSGYNSSDPNSSQNQDVTPSVTTGTVSNVTANTATAEGTVADNGTTVTERGVCWSSSNPMPTVYDSHRACGNGTGTFTANLDNLTPGTTYYVRAYATNGVVTAYGETVTFTTLAAGGDAVVDEKSCPGTPTVTDHEGNVYATVQIGSQCWMRENLRTTHYADGTAIPAGGDSWSSTEPYYYDYSSHSLPLETRGYLYNWPAAMHGASSSSANPSGVQGICPAGWHLPSDAEWTQLTNYVGSQSEYTCGGNSSKIATALASETGWNSGTNSCAVGNDPSGNNATGFSAVPAGYCNGSSFYNAGSSAIFWSSTQYGSYYAWSRDLYYNRANVDRCNDSKDYGFSVRCLRD